MTRPRWLQQRVRQWAPSPRAAGSSKTSPGHLFGEKRNSGGITESLAKEKDGKHLPSGSSGMVEGTGTTGTEKPFCQRCPLWCDAS